MTAATPRIANQTSDGRRFGIAMVMIVVAVALLVAVAVAQQATKSSATSATQSSHELIVGHIRYTGIPYPAVDPRTVTKAVTSPVVNAQTGFVTSGITVTHVSATSDDSPSFKGDQYSTGGAPYPIPGVVAKPPTIDDSTFFKNGISNPAPDTSPYYTGGMSFSGVPYAALNATPPKGTPRQMGTR